MKRLCLIAGLLCAWPASAQQQVFEGITPISSTAAESAHIIRDAPSKFYSAYATNFTGTSGFLVLINDTVVPGDGPFVVGRVYGCAPLPPNGNASISYNPGPPATFNRGVVAVLTSAADCLTKTTGTITGFISASVQ